MRGEFRGATMVTIIDVVEEVKEPTERLERAFGIRIHLEYVLFVARLARQHISTDLSLLPEKVFEILRRACLILKEEILKEAKEKELERYQYVLLRSLVEYNGLIKEKDRCSKKWLPRVEKELRSAENKLLAFINTWKPVLTTSTSMSDCLAADIYRLKSIYPGDSHDSLFEVYNRVPNIVEEIGLVLQQLDAHLHEQCKAFMVLSDHHILQAMSQLTGIPASWLDTTFKERILSLEERLRERVIGQDLLISRLISALLLRKALTTTGPLGSFLLMGRFEVGKAKLAKAIAKELYDDGKRLIQIDMTEYMEPHSIPSLGICKEESFLGKLTEAVRSKPYSVVLLENIEKAHYSVIESLFPILNDGKLMDGHGNVIDFTNTLIIMTSNVGEQHYRLSCICYLWDEKEKELYWRDPNSFHILHKCDLRIPVPDRVCKEAGRYFKPGLLKSLDDILAFDVLGELKAVCRILLRDWARAMVDRGHRGLVIYPSDAALIHIVTEAKKQYGRTGKAIKRWLDENIDSMLLKVLKECEVAENSTIYIDTLMGTEELSFRLENNNYMVEDWLFKQSEVSFHRLCFTYQKQRQIAIGISCLKQISFFFKDVWNGCSSDFGAIDAFCFREDNSIRLLTSPPRLVFDSRGMVAKVCCSENAKDEVQNLRSRLQYRVSGQQQAFDVISDAVLRSIDAPLNPPNRPARTYLFLGLTTFGKMELIKGLTELLLNGEWKDLLLQINLSECLDPHSQVLGAGNFINERWEFWILEAVRKRPYSILIFDQVEKADTEVFSTLLQILDTGVLADGQGRMVDFRNATIILNSDLGNKKIIAKIFGHSSTVDIQYENIQQGASHFRSELLNRVDEIVFFNPLSQEQLREVARLPMMECCHLTDGGGYSLQKTFFYLFSENDQPKIELPPEFLPENWVAAHISNGLLKNGACVNNLSAVS